MGVGVFGIDEMFDGCEWKYYMVGGKGGVGKMLLLSLFAVKFASVGYETLVVSMDSVYLLSDLLV